MVQILKKIFTLLNIITSYIIFCISFLFPRNKKIWVFIGWHRTKNTEIFSDNSKYLFLYTENNIKNINSVWLSLDKNLIKELNDVGFTAYNEKSLRGIYYALRAGYTFIDAYIHRNNLKYAGGTKLIQLLHGKGMKSAGYHQRPIKQYHFIFTPSEFTANLLPKQFIRKSKIFISGYSRNDVFFDEKINGKEIHSNAELNKALDQLKKENNKLILYAPTYRRNQTEQFNLEKILNMSELSKTLVNNNIHLFLFLHPKFAEKKYEFIYKNIHFLNAHDIYPNLNQFDVLICDYSSIFTDFLLLDKPIIFYAYDIEEYSKNEGIQFEYEKYTPGTKAYNYTELEMAIIDNLEYDNYKEERSKIKNLYHQYTDENSSKRIIGIIQKEDKLSF